MVSSSLPSCTRFRGGKTPRGLLPIRRFLSRTQGGFQLRVGTTVTARTSDVVTFTRAAERFFVVVMVIRGRLRVGCGGGFMSVSDRIAMLPVIVRFEL